MAYKTLADVDFVDIEPEEIETFVIGGVEKCLGRTLAAADPLRLFLMGIVYIITHLYELINETAKMNLLAYSKGDYLDHIGLLVGTERLEASASVTTLEFTLSTARETATTIPAGTRATAGDGVIFATDETAIIEKGCLTATVSATCTEDGDIGNDYAPGEIAKLVDSIAFIASVKNTTTSDGGSDKESDDSYRLRIQEAPEKFSTAGPTGAYEYHAKRANALIIDVSVDSPAPGEVAVRPLMQGGELPSEEILNQVSEVLNAKDVRPLTDKVTVEAPTAVSYDIELSYWIDRTDATAASSIQTSVDTAIKEFITWQSLKLGRDINPTELYYRLRAAGVKRAEIRKPQYTAISRAQVAVIGSTNAVFEGLEDD